MTSTAEASGLAPSQEKAATLRALYVNGDPLVLPNAWDAASARMVEAAEFPVVATSSSATARTLRYDDGEAAPVEELLAGASRIVRAVSLSVTLCSPASLRSARAIWPIRVPSWSGVEDREVEAGEACGVAEDVHGRDPPVLQGEGGDREDFSVEQ
jgi:phosphoenolpyruvate phosphomutase-like protein